MNIYCITASCGRHQLLERAVACFVAQDYNGEHTLLIYNNSSVPLELASIVLPANKHIELINNSLDYKTGEGYKTLGAIYTDALSNVPDTAEVICFLDDDDLFLPNHLSRGVEGLIRGGKDAYKPQFSWYRHSQGIEAMNNTLEPSMFIKAEFLREKGFRDSTSDQHLQWVNPLVSEGRIYVDQKGEKTLIYNWGDYIPTFKTSGNAGDPNNFRNYRNFSQDHGDKIITPLKRRELNKYFAEVPKQITNVKA